MFFMAFKQVDPERPSKPEVRGGFGHFARWRKLMVIQIIIWNLRLYIYITRNSWRKGSFLTTIDGNLKSSYQLPRSFGSLIGILLDGYFMQFLTSRVVQECTGLIYQRSHSQVWFLRTGVHKHVPNGRSESSICTGFSFWMGIIFVCVCLILIPGKKISWWHVDKVACKSLAIRMYTQMRGVYVARVSLFYLKMHRLGLEINHREQESRFWCWHWVQSKAAPSFGKPIDLRTAPFYWSYQQTQSFIKQVRQCMDWLHTRKLNGKVIEFSTSEPKCLGIVKAPS